METIYVRPQVLRKVTEHVIAALPEEAVGFLGGRTHGSVSVALPLPNIAEPRRFFADPLAQFRAERHFSELGCLVLAIYHSHPGGGSQLSQIDRLFARLQPEVVQVVISLTQPFEYPEMRAYYVREESVEEVVIEIRE